MSSFPNHEFSEFIFMKKTLSTKKILFDRYLGSNIVIYIFFVHFETSGRNLVLLNLVKNYEKYVGKMTTGWVCIKISIESFQNFFVFITA